MNGLSFVARSLFISLVAATFVGCGPSSTNSSGPAGGPPPKADDKPEPGGVEPKTAPTAEEKQPTIEPETTTETEAPKTATAEPAPTVQVPEIGKPAEREEPSQPTEAPSAPINNEPAQATELPAESEPKTESAETAKPAEAPEVKNESPKQVEEPAPNASNKKLLEGTLETVVARARSLRSQAEAFPLVRTPDGLALLPDEKVIPLTNDEALRSIDRRLSVQDDLERLKAQVSPEVRAAFDYTFLTPSEVDSLKTIRKELAKGLPADRVDTTRFAEINDELISNQRARVVAELNEAASKETDDAGYFPALAEIQAKMSRYADFLKKWGSRSKASVNEPAALDKVRAFLERR